MYSKPSHTMETSVRPAGEGSHPAAFFCSTSGTYFETKEQLSAHYKSDFHRYNLKRKVAGLPPVTAEWFEARKAQLASAAPGGLTSTGGAAQTKVWFDPLTKKKFSSENTYNAHVRSKRYAELVRASGESAPDPIVYLRKEDAPPAAPASVSGMSTVSTSSAARGRSGKTPGYAFLGPAMGGLPSAEKAAAAAANQEEEEVAEQDDDSGWETASDVDEEESEPRLLQAESQSTQDPSMWEAWDVTRSLFDNHVSRSFDANLEYMFKHFGFYFPDAEYLKDPEGLLKYLGAKLQQGRVPLYTSGADPNAKQFRSLHAVQRHMVDTNQCKMLFDDNEDEYAEFYDYSTQEEADDALALVDGSSSTGGGGYELVIPTSSGGTRVLGSREFARYYRQGYRPGDDRASVAINTMLAKYRALGIATTDDNRDVATKKAATTSARHYEATRLKTGMGVNVNASSKRANVKLPKNCTH